MKVIRDASGNVVGTVKTDRPALGCHGCLWLIGLAILVIGVITMIAPGFHG